MLGQYFFDYSQTNLIKRIKVTADGNLVKKHYKNHQWEDQSKHASHFVYYNFYEVHANVATPFDLQSQKTPPFGMHFGYVRKSCNIVSRKSHIWNSCAEPAIHNLDLILVKDHDFFGTKIVRKHCGNADGINGNGRPYVLVTFPYWMMTFQVDYIEF